MLKYLIIQLDDTSVSFCHYENPATKRRLISPADLKLALLWSTKENLTAQILYPDYEIPTGYKQLIDETDHVDIVSYRCVDNSLMDKAAVLVLDTPEALAGYAATDGRIYILRISFATLSTHVSDICSTLSQLDRLNIVITDIPGFDSTVRLNYSKALSVLAEKLTEEYNHGHHVQLNLLTDRLMLNQMNNCNAGVESLTIAPDGNFYVCPAFYLCDTSPADAIGNLQNGFELKNPQLFRLDHAPICRLCDAWHCRRCIWLNRKSTLEVNTPGQEQCITAHLERNASQQLLNTTRHHFPNAKFKNIDYLDPMEMILKNEY